MGIGFAVPIDTAKQIIPDLKQSGRVDRGYLGVDALTDRQDAEGRNVPVAHGALVQKVAPGGPAEKAGIRGGDLSATLDDHPIAAGRRHHHQDRRQGHPQRQRPVAAAVADRKSGDRVKVTLVRGGKAKTVEVTLGERPNTATAGQP